MNDDELRRRLSRLTYLEPQYIDDLAGLIRAEQRALLASLLKKATFFPDDRAEQEYYVVMASDIKEALEQLEEPHNEHKL